MKLSREDISKYGTEAEKKKLNEAYTKEAKKMAIFHIKREVNKIIGLLYEMNQGAIDDYDLNVIVSEEKYNRFTTLISKATQYLKRAKIVLEEKK